MEDQLDDQTIVAEAAVPPDELDNIRQATDFESRAAAVVAAVAAVAVALFVGQAASRQARSEATDGPGLRALGMTRRELAGGAALRWMPAAAGAAAIAVVAALGASALGPVGVARRGPWRRSIDADWTALVAGAGAVFVLVMLVGVGGAVRRRRSDSPSGVTAWAPAVASPSLRAGIGLARRSLGRRGALPLVSAVVATGLALALVITASGAVASLRLVTSEPARFGAPWDARIGNLDDEDAAEDLAALPGVVAADWLAGTDVGIDHEERVWIQAFVPVAGIEPTRPVIVEGREPGDDDEIALGSGTMSRLGIDSGDEVSLSSPSGADPIAFRVVGTAIVSDGVEANVGRGGIVTPEGLERVDTSAMELTELAVRLVDGDGRDDAIEALRDAFPEAQTPFPLPSSLANAERIAGLPVLLAVGGAVLAAVTLTHALIMSVRRNRRELAMYRVLGFSRRQVLAAVATHATLLALSALVIGVPLGVMGARWGWRAMAKSFGVATSPIVEVGAVSLGAVTALVVANLVAGVTARMAARVRPAYALREE